MIEILAPAGNIDALKSAVVNRADAVYLGLEQFNARLKADNFSTQNIKEWVEFCHLYGVKVYVTTNTLIKEKELKALDNILTCCGEAKVDAIIVTDLAVVKKARELCPNVSLHASTQMGVHNYLGAKFLEEIGFSRVVLSRECKLEDIKSIKENTNLEIEYFVHGAMCVCFSGSCLLSSISTGNSGNRGLCLQPCRKEYMESLTGSKGYLISPKDQCLVENLEELIKAGVTSFKIEGRLKSAEYVGLVTSKYRKAVDGITLNEQDYSEMRRVFNRGGFSKGYAFSDKNQILYTKTQNHIGEKIGVINNCIKAKDYYKLEILCNEELQNGDGIKIFRENTEVGGFEVSIIERKANVYKLYSKQPFSRGDNVHITLDNSLAEKYVNVSMPKILVDIECAIAGDEMKIISHYKNRKIEYVEKCNLEMAEKNATTIEEIEKQLSKTGGTPFEFEKVSISIGNNYFIPKSIINNFRRNFISYLKSRIIEINRLKINLCIYKFPVDFAEKYKVLTDENSDIIICDKIDLDRITCKSSTKIAVNYNYFDEITLNYGKKYNNLYIKLPKIALKADLDIIMKKLDSIPKSVGIYADNLYHYYIAAIQNRPVSGGLGLNIYNSEVVRFLGLKSFVASSELSKDEIKEIGLPCSVFSMGYLPVMNFCHCPVQHFTNCSCGDCKYKEYSLQDKFGEYKIRRIKIANCYFEMLNCNMHFIPKNEIDNGNFACIDVNAMENFYEMVNNYLNSPCFILNNSIKLTRGQYLRGVK